MTNKCSVKSKCTIVVTQTMWINMKDNAKTAQMLMFRCKIVSCTPPPKKKKKTWTCNITQKYSLGRTSSFRGSHAHPTVTVGQYSHFCPTSHQTLPNQKQQRDVSHVQQSYCTLCAQRWGRQWRVCTSMDSEEQKNFPHSVSTRAKNPPSKGSWPICLQRPLSRNWSSSWYPCNTTTTGNHFHTR